MFLTFCDSQNLNLAVRMQLFNTINSCFGCLKTTAMTRRESGRAYLSSSHPLSPADGPLSLVAGGWLCGGYPEVAARQTLQS